MGCDRLIELALFVMVNRALKLIAGEVLQGRSAHELQSRSNVRGRAEVTAQDQFVVRLRRDIISVHYPIIPTEFSDMADVSS